MGVFTRMMHGLASEAADEKTIMIDATYLKAHRTASSLRVEKGRGRLIGRPEGGMNTKLHAFADEVVTVPVPPLIDVEIFEAVQNRLKVNNPKVTPPRVVSGPNLLTGICYCGNCAGPLILPH